jgi:hypothetical protein
MPESVDTQTGDLLVDLLWKLRSTIKDDRLKSQVSSSTFLFLLKKIGRYHTPKD